MTIEITPAEAGANILRHVGRRTLRQKTWHDGRDIACLLGAIHADIGNSSDCPVALMPRWLAECTVILFDSIDESKIYAIASRYGALVASGAMARADDALRDRWLVSVIENAVESARAVSIELPCWPQVEAACAQVIAAIKFGKHRAEAAAEAAAACCSRLFTLLLDEIERNVA